MNCRSQFQCDLFHRFAGPSRELGERVLVLVFVWRGAVANCQRGHRHSVRVHGRATHSTRHAARLWDRRGSVSPHVYL